MFIGGAERSLLGLLDSFDYSKYEVSLFLYRHEGEFLEFIPKQVNVIPELDRYRTFDVPISSLLFSRLFIFGFARIIGKIAKLIHEKFKGESADVWMSMQYTSRFLLPLLPRIPGEYDLAIMFLGIGDVLVNKVNANTKITWNHTDYTTLNPDKNYDLSVFEKLDYIVSVSEQATKQLLQVYPSIKSKAITVENILSKDFLYKQSSKTVYDMPKDDNTINLLTVGRYAYAKNFDNIPEICKKIIAKGLPIKWYLIGYGVDEQLIKRQIAKSKMNDYVIMLGKKENPYPYIKACDIYVQPSRYEGKCVSVREAQILQKPVIITNYATSSSQLQDGYDGIIVPMDNEECANSISSVIQNMSLRQKLVDNTKKGDYTNAKEIEKIYRLVP